MQVPSKERGFTLAELVIVVTLIGLLIGGFIVGNGLLTHARTKFIVNQLEGLRIAVLTYQDRYRALPGDDPRAVTRWVAGAKDGNGDGRIGGSYQAPPPAGDPMANLVIVPGTGSGESLNFWWHLRLADLVVAPPSVITQVAQPLNPHLGVIGVEWAPFGFPGLAICTANVPGDVAIGVENHLDDGDPRRGMIRAARQNVENEAIASADATITSFSSDGSEKYILCQRLD